VKVSRYVVAPRLCDAKSLMWRNARPRQLP
jgi:hypothetical protein